MDAANTTPSTSKVIIQCTDPDNVLDAFESRLSSRTPLRNLHWKSPTRPLRSIPSLHIAIVRKDPSPNGAQPGARRHQIPGLRETPYLKLYLLRCDDKETYKESARKEIKQWIKENTLEKESKSSLRNQEHHDAYEWMIVHLVLPGTPAAGQPKSSKHISLDAAESTDSVNSKSKWTGKSSSTIFDKLRADFSSPKAAVPRVAQVRITEQGKPHGALSPSEVEEQWQELVDNLKAAILKSFDTRVSEYEEDIRERENQRSLPGWNFCTFFVLKEGLARGFENVGLLDDALAVYSELEMGLDLLLKENHEQDDVEGGALLPYAKDLKTVIRKALDTASDTSHTDASVYPDALTLQEILDTDINKSPFEIEGHNYRDLILKNQVSALDLRIYMFTRKLDILLRQSRLSEASKAETSIAHIDLNIVANIAEMAVEFINLAAREYRADLYAAWGGRLSGSDRTTQKILIGNVVATWTWSAIMQTLARILPGLDTNITRLRETPDSMLHNVLKAAPDDAAEKRPTSQDRHSISSASSSPRRGMRAQSLPRAPLVPKESLEVPAHRLKVLPRPGLDELCAWIARLCLLARNVLEELQATLLWSEELRNFALAGSRQQKKLRRLSSYTPSSLVNGSMPNTETGVATEDELHCLESVTLAKAASSFESFTLLYRLLSAYACHMFSSVGHRRALNQVLIELAAQAYSSGNKPFAAEYLAKVLDSDLKDGTTSPEPFAVSLYAECLSGEDRPNEYGRCLLACLQSSSARNSVDVAQGYFDRLVKIAPLVEPFDVPMEAILTIRDVDKTISHFSDRDGFQLSVRLRSPLHVSLVANEAMRLYLIAAHQQEPQQLILRGPSELDLDSKLLTLNFDSKISTQGWYKLDRLDLKIGNLVFVHNFQPEFDAGISVRPRKFQAPSVMVYPRVDAVSLEMMPATTIVLGETRLLSVTIRSAEDAITGCGIRLRAASAGLRLHLHNSTSHAPLRITREQETPILELEEINARSQVTIAIPYTLESTSDLSIMVKCEAIYEVNDETFSLYKICSVDVILPVSVNVQDVHRDSHWFSRFLIRPATLVPIVLWDCTIDGDSETVIETGTSFGEPVMVFPQQPANWTVRLRQHSPRTSKQGLVLNVRYQCLDELILNQVKVSFISALAETPYSQAGSLLGSHLVQTIKNAWTEQDLEVAGLTREMEVWQKQDMQWPSALCAFDETVKEGVKHWIEEWHSRATPIPIELHHAPVRLLKLRVDPPPRPPIVCTGFQMMNEPATIPVGQPVQCELDFHVSFDDVEAQTQDLEFSFELFALSEAWLIGGRKKGSFPGNKDGNRVQIILFPQRTGILLLPMIDVRCRRRDEYGPEAVGRWVDVPVDVHNRTLSKTLEVTPGLRSTTIGLTSNDTTQMSSGVMIDSQSWEGPPTE